MADVEIKGTRKEHWEEIYRTKNLSEVGWYQPNPDISLSFFDSLEIPVQSSVLDVGGGDSHLSEFLLEKGYMDVSVLDISRNAIERSQSRLQELSERIDWIIGDVTEYHHDRQFKVWHDRATFHFMLEVSDIEKYISIAARTVESGGNMIIGTFSERGPESCSGLAVKRYSSQKLAKAFLPYFELIESRNVDHVTPNGVIQNYTFCSFVRRS